jgi:hypothetical protein
MGPITTIIWKDNGAESSLNLDTAVRVVVDGLARFEFPTLATGLALAKARAARKQLAEQQETHP